jgi:hypothetical protein
MCGSKRKHMTKMPACIFAVILAALAVPAGAAVLLSGTTASDAAALSISNPANYAAPANAPAVPEDPVDYLGNVLASYAAMLPIPADWVLLVTGFGAIGYAMRSRKRGRVNFN